MKKGPDKMTSIQSFFKSKVMSADNSPENYEFHQTPPELGRDLMAYLAPHIEPGDVLYEPFAGEGAFLNAFPAGNPKHWTEISKGRDYKDFTETYDWVITNPPFKFEGDKGNAIFPLLDYFTNRARKGVAFFISDYGLGTLTPKRREVLRRKGWDIVNIVMAQVKKWRGRYYLVVLKPSTTSCLDYLAKTY